MTAADNDDSVVVTRRKRTDPIRAPLSIADLKFLRSHGVCTDDLIADMDAVDVANRYERYRSKRKWAKTESAPAVAARWVRSAREVLGRRGVGGSGGRVPLGAKPNATAMAMLERQRNRQEFDPILMDNIRFLCETTVHPKTGLPRRLITSFDCKNGACRVSHWALSPRFCLRALLMQGKKLVSSSCSPQRRDLLCFLNFLHRQLFLAPRLAEVLYDFVIDIRHSNIKGAGRGAFLTFKGARVLKPGVKSCNTQWQHLSRTRRELQAVLPDLGMGVAVKLSGHDLHGDEHLMGTSRGVGMFRQYDAEHDFIPAPDNLTFCSFDNGSGLVELGRYAPLVKEDRKTDLVFAVKDFLFSFEPSAWRFDVPEGLHGYSQVVDFTSDTTGEPHNEARRHVAMYINETGHNPELCQNVVSRDDNRSVYYYLLMDEPIQKGATVELLVNYLEGYEGKCVITIYPFQPGDDAISRRFIHNSRHTLMTISLNFLSPN